MHHDDDAQDHHVDDEADVGSRRGADTEHDRGRCRAGEHEQAPRGALCDGGGSQQEAERGQQPADPEHLFDGVRPSVRRGFRRERHA